MNSTTIAAQTARYYIEAAQLKYPDQCSWITRAANFVIVYSEVEAGARLERIDQPDEYMVLLSDVSASVQAGGESLNADAGSLIIVPPGDSEVVAKASGRIVRVFSNLSTDLLALAGNAAAYGPEGRAGVAPLVPWPDPVDGYKLRHYVLADHARDGNKTRIFRCTNLMINVLMPRDQARDVTQLSPHSHVDFEQGSLALAGTWIHHLRTPWTPNMTEWRDDEHLSVDSPSLAVIAPTIVHTSRNINAGHAWLVDVFSPPRLDFSIKDMVLNANEYPMPATKKS